MPFSPVDVNRMGGRGWNPLSAKYSTKSSNNPIDQGGLASAATAPGPNSVATAIIRTGKTSNSYD